MTAVFCHGLAQTPILRVKRKTTASRLVMDNFTGTYGTGEDTIHIQQCYLVDEVRWRTNRIEGESKPAYAAETSFTIKYRSQHLMHLLKPSATRQS